MERRFEDEWRRAFDGAEVEPGAGTWQGIEAAVVAAENGVMRHRIVFYQRLAAASVLFAISMSVVGIYQWNSSKKLADQNEMVLHNIQQQSPVTKSAGGTEASVSENNPLKTTSKVVEQRESGNRNTMQPTDNQGQASKHFLGSSDALPVMRQNTTEVAAGTNSAEGQLAEITGTHQTGTVLNNQTVVEQQAEVAETKTEQEPPVTEQVPDPAVEKAQKAVNRENLWAAVNFAAGNYGTGTSGTMSYAAPMYSASSMPATASSRQPVGVSRSVGISVGKRIGARWVVVSGLSYLTQTSSFTSNTSNQGQVYLYGLTSSNQSSAVTYGSPYSINSVLEFLSVPLQAGYMIIDQKVGFQVNSGVSADFLLKNTLEDPSGQKSNYSQGAGEDSPYRSVNWAGLVNTELSYRIGRQYRISVMPGIRYFFSPILKNGSSHSYTADLGFRFRYILR